LLSVPLVGRFLRWRHARLALQVPMAVLAIGLVVDGLRGPQVGALNVAGVLPWIHWRGLAVLGLVAAGNLSCMACPFVLPATLARRWLPRGLRWPRALRNKGLPIALLVLFLWAYEALALWDRPALTAWIIVGYFVAAFVVDGLFRGASFCKHVCPIGQFNFVYAQVAPLEVQAVDPDVCARCRTRDCLRGRESLPGCGLGLFQPRKVGNLDCTFCLDCLHACPHDNIAIAAGWPGRDLVIPADRPRSGIGRLAQRRDIAALMLVLAFGAFVNAAGMIGPVLAAQARVGQALGWRSPMGVVTLFSLPGLLVLPLLVHGAAAGLSRRWGGLERGLADVMTRYAPALVPVGLGMWLAHATYHLVTSYGAAVPTAQRFVSDLGWPLLGQADWSQACCQSAAGWLLRLETVCLQLGMLLSLHTAYRISVQLTGRPSRGLRAFAPWALVIGLLCLAGLWIVHQPMQMRGMLSGAG
jgi:hypothetical protein